MTRSGKDEPARETGSRAGRGAQDVSRYEWLAAIFGTAVVLAAVGFLLYDAVAVPASAPDIAIEVDSIVQTSGGYLVEFRAVNTGHSTAASVVVQGELLEGANVVETSEATIDYVPEQGSRSGGVLFHEDPRRYRLEISPRGYERP